MQFEVSALKPYLDGFLVQQGIEQGEVIDLQKVEINGTRVKLTGHELDTTLGYWDIHWLIQYLEAIKAIPVDPKLIKTLKVILGQRRPPTN